MMNCTCPQGSWDRTKQCKHILWNKFTFKRSNNMMWAMIFAVSQTSSASSQRLNKISKLKGSKGRVNMLNLSKSVPQGCWRFRSNRCQDWLANNNASGQFYMWVRKILLEGARKKEMARELRPVSVDNQEMCSYCGNKDFESDFKLFVEVVNYCSKICQRKHWASHKDICDAISDLTVKRSKKVEHTGIYNSFYIPKEKSQLINLIGRKSIVNCFYLIFIVAFCEILKRILVLSAKATLNKNFHI